MSLLLGDWEEAGRGGDWRPQQCWKSFQISLDFTKAGERQTLLPPVSRDSDSSTPAPRLARRGPARGSHHLSTPRGAHCTER